MLHPKYAHTRRRMYIGRYVLCYLSALSTVLRTRIIPRRRHCPEDRRRKVNPRGNWRTSRTLHSTYIYMRGLGGPWILIPLVRLWVSMYKHVCNTRTYFYFFQIFFFSVSTAPSFPVMTSIRPALTQYSQIHRATPDDDARRGVVGRI